MNLLLLTCANEKESLSIARALLEKKLIVCAKLIPVKSQFLWKNNLENAEEILLIMESHETKFEEVEETVKTLHSYEQFVLLSLPINQMSTGVDKWLKSEIAIQ